MSARQAPNNRRHGGFTLVETLVVMVICVGLVMLMGSLYHSVGVSAVSLRSGQQEWALQRQMREQLLHLLVAAKTPLRSVAGNEQEFFIASWLSKGAGMDGKPVLANYRFEPEERRLSYRELPLPAWWENAGAPIDAARLQSEVQASPAWKVLTGVEQLTFLYLPADAPDLSPERWRDNWQQEEAPRLVQLQFKKGGRNYSLIFEIRGTDV